MWYVCSSIGTEAHYDLCLENQNGDPILLEESDRTALIMGLTLHDKAQQLMHQVQMLWALEILGRLFLVLLLPDSA